MSSYLKPGTSLEWQYVDILKEMLSSTRDRHVRGFNTKELSPFVWTTDHPLQNILSNTIRKINRRFSIAEFLWILSGRNDVEMISFYNKNISDFSDNCQTFRGAYGEKIQAQLEYVLNCFKTDLNTRQAIINIWRENPQHSKDVPCTLSFQFMVNKDELDMMTVMRSNDIWLGFPYDIYNFTMIQNYLAMKLNLKIGKYTHVANSEHLYEKNYDIAKKASEFVVRIKDIKETEAFTTDDLNKIMKIEKEFRTKNLILNDEISTLYEPWKDMCKTLLKLNQER